MVIRRFIWISINSLLILNVWVILEDNILHRMSLIHYETKNKN